MEKSRILLVDDEPRLSHMIAMVLEAEGFEVEQAENGRVGLRALEESEPEVILLDLEMPEVDGRTFYNECRSAGFEGPVVIVSGFGARRAQRELGAQAALEKPFDPDELIDIVRHLVPAA